MDTDFYDETTCTARFISRIRRALRIWDEEEKEVAIDEQVSDNIHHRE